MNPLAPVIAIVLPVTLCIAEHYAPWQRWIGRPLPTFAAYALGSLSVFVTATIAALVGATSTVDVLLLFWAALLCAGVAVGIMRGVEWQAERVNRLHDQMDRQYYGSSK